MQFSHFLHYFNEVRKLKNQTIMSLKRVLKTITKKKRSGGQSGRDFVTKSKDKNVNIA